MEAQLIARPHKVSQCVRSLTIRKVSEKPADIQTGVAAGTTVTQRGS